jgi:hypothetical protein
MRNVRLELSHVISLITLTCYITIVELRGSQSYWPKQIRSCIKQIHEFLCIKK